MLDVVGNTFFPFKDDFPTDLSDCEVKEDPARLHRWLIVEPLKTKAPASAAAHCCYRRTIIFYEQPWRILPDKKELAKYDEIEHRLTVDDVVRLDGELLALGCGQVMWQDGRWIMVHGAIKLYELPAHLEAAV